MLIATPGVGPASPSTPFTFAAMIAALWLMALVDTFGFNFQVVLPLLARFSFDGGAGTYAVLVSAMASARSPGRWSPAPAAAPARA